MLFSKRTAWASFSNKINDVRLNLERAGLNILDLSQSNPTLVDLPILDFSILNSKNISIYKPESQGLLETRKAISDYKALMQGARPCPAENYFLTASSSEAYGWILKLICENYDRVLVPKPGYPLLEFISTLEDVNIHYYTLKYSQHRSWYIDFEDLIFEIEESRPRAIILINPNNPTGSYIYKEEMEKLIEIAIKYDLALIVDEVFFKFALSPKSLKNRLSFSGENRVNCFVIDGISKALGLPQLKLSWFSVMGPKAYEAIKRLEILADTYLNVSTSTMLALPKLLISRNDFFEATLKRIDENLKILKDSLETKASPLRILHCDGSWSALIEVPKYKTEEEMVIDLMQEQGLYCQPGFFFNMDKEAYFSISLIIQTELFKTGLKKFMQYFRSV